MKHLQEAIRLYANDPEVDDALFGRFVREAVEMDKHDHPTDYVLLHSAPVLGRPGWRRDDDGRLWYSADWLNVRGLQAVTS